MNKHQEALNEMYAVLNDSNRFHKQKDLLQELVDKERPLKPKMNDYKITRLDKIIGIEQTYTCPRCRNACLEMLAVNKRNIHRYCYDCGQKLDWT